MYKNLYTMIDTYNIIEKSTSEWSKIYNRFPKRKDANSKSRPRYGR